MDKRRDYYLGLDLGGTSLRVCLARGLKEPLSSVKIKTEAEGGLEHVLDRIQMGIDLLLKRRGVSLAEVRALGLGAPGEVDFQAGMVCHAPNLGWVDIPLQGLLEERLGLSVKIDNDANVAAWGEYTLGAGRGMENLLYLSVGTGIGGGIIINGSLYRGASGGAGEFGHLILKEDGPRCGCGNRGCLEAMVAGPALVKGARLVALEEETLMEELAGSVEKIEGEVVTQAARKGDRRAQELFSELGYRLGTALISLTNIFNPEGVVIGGGVSEAGEYLLSPVRERIRGAASMRSAGEVAIKEAELGQEAGLKGALSLAINHE